MSRVAIHDAYGLNPIDGALLTTSVGGAYDRQRLVLTGELEELERQPKPKMVKAESDKEALIVAQKVLNDVQATVDRAKTKVPLPTWLHNPDEFKAVVLTVVFESSSQKNHVSRPSVEQTMNTYDLSPASADDVSAKITQASQQILEMDGLMGSINSKFEQLARHAKSPEEMKILAKMGITSVDGIYALDPGKFRPDDGAEYNPRNMIHVLKAVDHFMDNPAEAMREGMSLYGPKAISEIRAFMSDRMPAPAGYNPGVSPSIMGAISPPAPPASPGYTNRYGPGLM